MYLFILSSNNQLCVSIYLLIYVYAHFYVFFYTCIWDQSMYLSNISLSIFLTHSLPTFCQGTTSRWTTSWPTGWRCPAKATSSASSSCRAGPRTPASTHAGQVKAVEMLYMVSMVRVRMVLVFYAYRDVKSSFGWCAINHFSISGDSKHTKKTNKRC